MADYYPLIQRAVSGLEKNTGENRRTLYDRARTALVTQLRNADPPLGESDITRERLALEESIRKVEADAARRTPAPFDEDEQPSLRDEGLKGFRDNVAEADSLGGAAEEATRSAREVYGQMPGAHEYGSEHESEREPPDEAMPPPAESNFDSNFDGTPEPAESRVPPGDPEWQPSTAPYDEDDYARPARNWGRIATIAVIVVVVAGIAGAGYWKRHAITSWVSNFRSGTPAPVAKQGTTPAGRPKIADRIGPNGAGPSSANAPAASVAQKVVLYDEVPNDPNGKRYVGSAIWRTETVSPGPGLAPELAIRADIEIPERKVRMTWSLRRNTDKALPASHTIEIMFTLPADFAEGGIANIPGVLMEQDEQQQRGTPLAGLAVKVTNGYFLIGLSSVDVDLQRNLQLLKERGWLDIPLVYNSGKRALLRVEKGAAGSRVFEEAFRAWGE